MQQIKFHLQGDYIELIQLLKATGIAQTGGHAKMIVDNGLVYRNGELETRKRAKLKAGDELQIDSTFDVVLIESSN